MAAHGRPRQPLSRHGTHRCTSKLAEPPSALAPPQGRSQHGGKRHPRNEGHTGGCQLRRPKQTPIQPPISAAIIAHQPMAWLRGSLAGWRKGSKAASAKTVSIKVQATGMAKIGRLERRLAKQPAPQADNKARCAPALAGKSRPDQRRGRYCSRGRA